MTWLIRDTDARLDCLLGGKADGLIRLREFGFGQHIPPWFAIAPAAFYASLSPEQCRELVSARTPHSVRSIVAGVRPAENLEQAIIATLESMSLDRSLLAIRSSALDEDQHRHSFAGQFESHLDVSSRDVAQAVSRVWQSAFGERVEAYRFSLNHVGVPSAPAVIVQQMVAADASGIVFSTDPTAPVGVRAAVTAVIGPGDKLASGEASGDTWQVTRTGEVTLVQQPHLHQIHRATGPTSVEPESFDARHLQSTNILTEEQVRRIAELAFRIERLFGTPQDIEWAMAGGELYLLQARPITARAPERFGPISGTIQIWDNSNIGESYSGVTTPLTFSFARRAYEDVYRRFCQLLGVPARKLYVSDDIFRNMLGLLRGQIYYNLLNWYRALALLPGFSFNRGFMEQMMGVKEGLPASLVEDLAKVTWFQRALDGCYMLRSVVSIVCSHLTIRTRKRLFDRRIKRTLGQHVSLSGLSIDELVGYYRRLERQLLPNWDAPLINDFLGMIFFGVLRRCLIAWCGDHNGSLQNDLIAGEDAIISIEPARRIRRLAESVAAWPELVEAFSSRSSLDVQDMLRRFPTIGQELQQYIAEFGDRCLQELKLESKTLQEDMTPLLRSIGRIAAQRQAPQTTAAPTPDAIGSNSSRRLEAEQHLQVTLKQSSWRRWLVRWLLQHTRARVRDRENLRFERTRLFGRARQIFLELGRKLRAQGSLQEENDIFYLEVNEILGFVEGTATGACLSELANARRSEFDVYRREKALPNRVQTRGGAFAGRWVEIIGTTSLECGESRSGLGCSAGIVQGRVRVVNDPRIDPFEHGEILVARQTDPGWILLFPSAAGLIVERGSLLSHSAIVARELKLPAVVGVSGATSWLQTGELVEVNGMAGTVTRLLGAADSAGRTSPDKSI